MKGGGGREKMGRIAQYCTWLCIINKVNEFFLTHSGGCRNEKERNEMESSGDTCAKIK